jgi:hypothetical protein
MTVKDFPNNPLECQARFDAEEECLAEDRCCSPNARTDEVSDGTSMEES